MHAWCLILILLMKLRTVSRILGFFQYLWYHRELEISVPVTSIKLLNEHCWRQDHLERARREEEAVLLVEKYADLLPLTV